MNEQLVDAPLEVDRESLLELARGANLYASPFAFVRELLQNAVDATLLRAFADHGPESFPTHERSLLDLRALLQRYPIDVSLTRTEGAPDAARRVYEVVIEDRGIGIAREDVPYLQTIGSSRKNPKRAGLIARMPEWMRPSGAFGIGLQSVFMATDELRLSSRSLVGDAVELRVRTAEGGRVTARAGTRSAIGTRVELRMVFEADDDEAARWWGRCRAGLDPLDDAPFDTAIDRARELLRDLARACCAPVRLDGRALPRPEPRGVLDPETLIELTLPETDDGVPDPTRSAFLSGFESFHAHYRGAPIQPVSPQGPWSWSAWFGEARTLCRLDRDAFTPVGHDEIAGRLRRALLRHLPEALEKVEARGDAPRLATWYSAFLFEQGVEIGESWRRRCVSSSDFDGTATLGELADAPHLTSTPDGLTVPGRDESFVLSLEVHAALARIFRGLEWDEQPRFVREPVLRVSERATEAWLRGRRLTTRGRGWLPCPDDFEPLRHRASEERTELFPGLEAFVISPWLFVDGAATVARPERWLEAQSRARPDAGRAAILDALTRFLVRFDPVLRTRDDVTVDYTLEDALEEVRGLAG